MSAVPDRLHTNCVVENSKGKRFAVAGYFWISDGSFFVRNPRPERYPYAGLIGARGSLELQWVHKDLAPVELSPFKILEIVFNPKPPKTVKKGLKNKTPTKD